MYKCGCSRQVASIGIKGGMYDFGGVGKKEWSIL